MKYLLIVGLVLSGIMTAQANTSEEKMSVWPRITVWPNGIDLRINNYTEDDYSCSGSIFIYHESGRTSSEYYFGRVYARSNEWRYYTNRVFNDRIRNAHHSIYCYKL